MKKRFFLAGLLLSVIALAVWGLLPVTAQAAGTVESGSCDEALTWELDSDGVLTISGSGPMPEFGWHENNGELPPWNAHKAAIRKLKINEGVTTIGSNAFYACTTLENAFLPDSLLEIGDQAFYGCTALQRADLPKDIEYIGSQAFASCESLQEIYLQPRVQAASGVFSGCRDLVSINIPQAWTSIPDSFVDGCVRIKQVTLHEGITEIGSSAFSGTGITAVAFPKTLTTIKSYAFHSSKLKDITIPAHVQTVGLGAFGACEQLSSVTVAAANTSFEAFVFVDCTALTAVSLPEGMQKIGAAMFDGCTSLAKISIPESVTHIGAQAFMDCSKLTELRLPAGVTEIGNNAFLGCAGITKLVLPEGLKTIPDAMVSGCTGLKELKIPESVTSIGVSAFSGCTALTEITIPDSVTTLGRYAFYECKGLLKVKLPDHLETIGEQTFAFCMNLENVNFPKNVKQIGEHAFKGVVLPKLILPEGLEVIGDSAFYACLIKCVYIPKSVTSIGAGAFDGNVGLWHVLYGGTQAQWKQINMGAQNELLLQPHRHYSATGDEITDVDQRICKHCGVVCEHQWDNGAVTKEATCKSEGELKFTCQKCQTTRTETIAKLSQHAYDHGCDPDCNSCGETRSTSHDWTSSVTKEATCKEQGTLTYTCRICWETKTEKIPLLTEHTWDDGKLTKGATCKEEGICTFTCTVCDKTRKESIPKRTSHLYDNDCDPDCNDCGAKRAVEHEWEDRLLREPTCKEEGVMLHSCKRCGKSEKESIAKTEQHTYDHDCDDSCNVCGAQRKTEHRYEETWVSDQQSHWHACSVCAAVAHKAEHTPGPEATESAPQCCTVCGAVLVPALDHTHSWEAEYRTDGSSHWYGCAGCGERKDETAHSYDHSCDADCNICGYTRTVQHTPGPEATATDAQVCTQCGALLKPATGVPEQTTESKETQSPTVPVDTQVPTVPADTEIPAGTDAPTGTDAPGETETTDPSGAPGETGAPGQTGTPEHTDSPSGADRPGQSGTKQGGWGWLIAVVILLALGAVTGFALWRKKNGKR